MRGRSKSRKLPSKKANLSGNTEQRIRLRAYPWLEAEAEILGTEKRRKVKAIKAAQRDQADGEQWPEVLQGASVTLRRFLRGFDRFESGRKTVPVGCVGVKGAARK